MPSVLTSQQRRSGTLTHLIPCGSNIQGFKDSVR
jgi:hypothetical protein